MRAGLSSMLSTLRTSVGGRRTGRPGWATLMAGLVLALLAGCGPIYSYSSAPAIAQPPAQAPTQAAPTRPGLRALVASVNPFRREAELPAPQDILTPEVLARATTPLLLMQYEDRVGWALFQPIVQNGDVLTWLSDSGESLSFDSEGMLQATRGLGRDLMTADTAPITRFLGQGRRQGTDLLRVQEFLDAQNTVLRMAYICDVTDAGVAPRRLLNATPRLRELRETCTGGDGREFTNLYWLDPVTGLLRGSTQWVSPENGRVTLEVVAQ